LTFVSTPPAAENPPRPSALATALTEGASEFGRGYRELDRELVRRLASLVATLAARGRMRPRHDPQTVAEVLYSLSNARFLEFAADPAMTREAAEALTRRDLALVVETMRVGGVRGLGRQHPNMKGEAPR
jgi:hypothetical protein